MKIAIIGAGFSGLATAWHLLQHPTIQVTLYDSIGIGGGASGMAAGLLHTYAGLHSKLNWNGMEGYQSACRLLDLASQSSQNPVYEKSGILRIALNDSIENDYHLCADKFPDVEWLSTQQCQNLIPGVVKKPGLLIKSALTVYCLPYLEGLWKVCAERGAVLKKDTVTSLNQLDSYDQVIVTAGALTSTIKGVHDVQLSIVKGQILHLEWPVHLAPLVVPLNSQAYIVMNPDKKSCIIGATYERNYESEGPDPTKAIEEILPKAIEILPELKNAKILSCQAGLRSSTPNHRPFMKRIDNRTCVLAGMGSKGLLYHALFAEKLVNELILFK